jgi:carnitine-CoA ligase
MNAPELSPVEVLRSYPEHDYTLAGLVASRATADPDRALVLDERGAPTSWRDLTARSEALAWSLHARGVRKGDRLAIMARNDVAHAVLLVAAARLGAIMVPVNSELGVEEVAGLFEHAGVTGIVSSPELLDTVRGARRRMAEQPWLCTIGRVEGELSFEDLSSPQAGRTLDHPVVDVVSADDAVIIIFTSGSSGRPKGVVHTQRSMILSGEAYVDRVHLQPHDRVLIILPLFHINAMFYSLCGTLAAGASCILVPRFSASTFWKTAADLGATVVNATNTVVNILMARPREEYREDHDLRAISGGGQPHNEKFLREVCGITTIIAGYGMTEIPGVLTTPFEGPYVSGSMGVVGKHPDSSRPWAECRVVDAEGNDVPDGEVGELWVKTPNIMKEYFRDEARTRAAFREGGWFCTEDLVRREADGVFYFVARNRDIIKRRGENISPVEVEKVILRHPAVLDVAVIPAPGELGDEELCAVIVLAPGQEATAAEVAGWCADHLAPVKVPRFVTFLDELPRTGPDKIAKEVLRADPRVLASATDLGRTSASRRH